MRAYPIRQDLVNATLPIDEVSITVPPSHPDDYRLIKASVESEPLEYPPVVVAVTHGDWRKFINLQSVFLKPDESIPDETAGYFVTCGNNRVRALKELGYTEVDVLMVESFSAGSGYCKEMRKWFNAKQGKRNR
jgi:hypothetical protein